MSLVSLGWKTPIPYPPGLGAAVAIAFNPSTLDASAEYVGHVFWAPKAGTIKKINIPLGTVTTAGTTDVTVEGVSATDGQPSGTPLSGGSTTLEIGTGDSDTTAQAVFSTGPTVTQGQLIAIRIANSSASPTGVFQVNSHISNSVFAPFHLPYRVSGLPSAAKSSQWCTLGVEYSDGSYAHIPGFLPCSNPNTNVSINTTTDPDEMGLKFKLPFPCRINGFWAAMTVGSGGFNARFYSSQFIATSVTIDPDRIAATNSSIMFYEFAEDFELDANTFYRVTISPTTATSVTMRYLTVPSVAAMDALEGGQDFHLTQRTDAGQWTDQTTLRPHMGILVSALPGVGAAYANMRIGL